MASLRKDPRGFSKYWYACITIPGKGQTQRCTKLIATERNRGPEGHVAGVPTSAAERAFEQMDKRLRWGRAACEIIEHTTERGQGFVLTGEVASEAQAEVFTAFGERGIRAEAVADRMVEQVRSYLAAGLPVGEYMADQFLLPMGLAGGGAFRTAGLSLHARTNIEVIQAFLQVLFHVQTLDTGGVEIRLQPTA